MSEKQNERRAAWRPVLLIAGAALLGIALLIPAAALIVNAVATYRPILGLNVGDAGVVDSFFSPEKAVDMLASTRESTEFTLVAGAARVETSWEDLAVGYDRAAMLDSVRGHGRDGDLLSNIGVQLRAVLGLEQIPSIAPTVTGARLDEELARILAETTREPVDAHLSFDVGSANVEIVADVPGVRLDARAARAAVIEAAPWEQARVELPLRDLPAERSAAELESARAEAQDVVGGGIVVVADEARLELAPEQVFAALRLVAEPKAGESLFDIDQSTFAEPVGLFVEAVTIAPQDRVLRGDAVVAEGAAGRSLSAGSVQGLIAEALRARAGGTAITEVVAETVVVQPAVVQQREPSFGTGHVYLTFDDGPGEYTEALLDVLAGRGAPATFYVLGEKVLQHPASARRIVNDGHRIANHTMNHPDLTMLSDTDIRYQVGETQRIIAEVTGVHSTAFRPPYGAHDSRVRQVVGEYGLSFDLWTIDPLDWQRPGAAVVVDRVLSNLAPGAVILLHVQHPGTLEALPAIIDGIRAAGYTLG